MVEINGSYVGSLRCSLKHGPSGTVIETDAPADNHGRAERFSPTDLIAASLLSCMATTLAIKTREKGWNLEGISMRVEKIMSSDAPRRIVGLPAEVVMPVNLSKEDRQEAESIMANCPVFKSIHPDIKTSLTVHWPA